MYDIFSSLKIAETNFLSMLEIDSLIKIKANFFIKIPEE
jgi:hypothetical protein